MTNSNKNDEIISDDSLVTILSVIFVLVGGYISITSIVTIRRTETSPLMFGVITIGGAALFVTGLLVLESLTDTS